MYHIIHIMMVPRVSQHCLFNCTYMQLTVWQNVLIQTLQHTIVKLKAKDIFYLPGMDSANMK